MDGVPFLRHEQFQLVGLNFRGIGVLRFDPNIAR